MKKETIGLFAKQVLWSKVPAIVTNFQKSSNATFESGLLTDKCYM